VASVTNTMQETQVLNQAPLAASHLSLWRHFSPGLSAERGAALWSVSSCHLSRQWSSADHRELRHSREPLCGDPFPCRWACLTFFLSAQLFRWEPEAKTPRRAKLLVAATAIPFLLLGVVENRTDRILIEAKSAFLSMTSQMSAPRTTQPALPRSPHPVKIHPIIRLNNDRARQFGSA